MSTLLYKFLMDNATVKTLDCFHAMKRNKKLSNAQVSHLLFDLEWDIKRGTYGNNTANMLRKEIISYRQ